MAVLPIEAPTPKPGNLGLLSVAEEVSLPTHWEQDGVSFFPDPCGLPTPIPLDCVPSEDVDESPYDPPTYSETVTWRPFLAIGRDNCGYLHQQGLDREAIVRRHLEVTESYQAEQEFMFLAATGGTTKENPGLFSEAGAVDVAPTSESPSAVVAAIDGALYTALGGQEGILHISPTLASLVLDDFEKTPDGFRSQLGHRVAIGSGYQVGTGLYALDGTAGTPTVGGNVVFGTPMVYFTRGDIVVHGLDSSQTNYRQNTANVWAERPLLVWTSRCAVVGAFADLSLAGITDSIDGGGA